MSRQFVLRMLTVLVAGSGFAGVAQSQDRKDGAEGDQPLQIQIQLNQKKSEDGGLVLQLGKPRYWLGVALEGEDRLELSQVYQGSPAATAGLKPNDVLLSVDGTAVKSLAELQKILQASDGKSLKLTFQRDGKEQVVEVKPALRPREQPLVLGEGDDVEAGQLLWRFHELAEQARKQAESVQIPPVTGWRAVPWAASSAPLPDDLEVTIKKKGGNPARIKVRQGEQTWSVSEKELDELPESIRGHVARMLPGRAPVTMWPAAPTRPLPANPAPNPPGSFRYILPSDGQRPPGATIPAPQDPGGPLRKELQEIKNQLRELQEQVEALRKK